MRDFYTAKHGDSSDVPIMPCGSGATTLIDFYVILTGRDLLRPNIGDELHARFRHSSSLRLAIREQSLAERRSKITD